MSKLQETGPEVIYLQVSDEKSDNDQEWPEGAEDFVTWAQESVLSAEVKYIRADLVVMMRKDVIL